jgi:hypothetical protein
MDERGFMGRPSRKTMPQDQGVIAAQDAYSGRVSNTAEDQQQKDIILTEVQRTGQSTSRIFIRCSIRFSISSAT